MAEQWPASLQSALNRANFSEKEMDTNIRTTSETGPKKVRRRFTRSDVETSVQIWIKNTDYETLKTFTNITLKDRTLSFFYNHPVTGNQVEYRMEEPEVITPLGGLNFVVNMKWIMIPSSGIAGFAAPIPINGWTGNEDCL